MPEARQEWHSSESVGVVASVAAFALFAFKLMAVSHGSVNTAKALLQTSSLGESLLGVALSGFIPIACAVAFLYALLRLGHAYAEGSDASPWLALALVLMIVIGFLISIVWALGGAVLLGGLLLARRRLRRGVGAPLRRVLALAILVPAAVLLIDDSVWLPYERYDHDGTDLVGYTVAENEDVLVVLRDRDRIVQRIPVSEISDREYCVPDHESWFGWSFTELVKSKRPQYDLCPKG
ncbi:MAG TPA: hypothetical protein VF230_08850 [Acidimicrobiales bacterium]